MSLDQVKALYHQKKQTGGGKNNKNREASTTSVSDSYSTTSSSASAPASGGAAPGLGAAALINNVGKHGDNDALFNVWVESSTNQEIKYEPIKCSANLVFNPNNNCEKFINEFINGDTKTKHEYIKNIANGYAVPTIKDINQVHPKVALSFLSAMGLKKRKYLDDRQRVHKVVYKVEPYDEWKKRIDDEDTISQKPRAYASDTNVKSFVKSLIEVLNNNLQFLNKSFIAHSDGNRLYENEKTGEKYPTTIGNAIPGTNDSTPTVPAKWLAKDLDQAATNKWYREFIAAIRGEWDKQKKEYNDTVIIKNNMYGKKIDLIDDQPREGASIFFSRILGSPYFVGGSKSDKVIESKWSEIKQLLSDKNLKLMGNVDIDEKLKEYGNILEKKDDLFKIMSDYSKFVNSANLNSSKDITLLVGGYKELLSKEEETSEYLNKKLYVMEKLISYVNV